MPPYPQEDRPELRRRSKRVKMRIPVIVRLQGKTSQIESTHTMVINAHGALLILAMRLQMDCFIVVENPATKKELLGRVVHIGASFMGKTQVAVEFIRPDPEFWGIATMPKDWKSTRSSPHQEVVKSTVRG
ncbi:MAG TPA: PilZ domain-containing protein [Candidatus Acidoferrales bacterium]|nr:PilZ domain-containing protein [Candidatus Acidoferrales bacterium]